MDNYRYKKLIDNGILSGREKIAMEKNAFIGTALNTAKGVLMKGIKSVGKTGVGRYMKTKGKRTYRNVSRDLKKGFSYKPNA